MTLPYRIYQNVGTEEKQKWKGTFLKAGSEKELEKIQQMIEKIAPVGGQKIVTKVQRYDNRKKPKPEPETEAEPEPETEAGEKEKSE